MTREERMLSNAIHMNEDADVIVEAEGVYQATTYTRDHDGRHIWGVCINSHRYEGRGLVDLLRRLTDDVLAEVVRREEMVRNANAEHARMLNIRMEGRGNCGG